MAPFFVILAVCLYCIGLSHSCGDGFPCLDTDDCLLKIAPDSYTILPFQAKGCNISVFVDQSDRGRIDPTNFTVTIMDDDNLSKFERGLKDHSYSPDCGMEPVRSLSVPCYQNLCHFNNTQPEYVNMIVFCFSRLQPCLLTYSLYRGKCLKSSKCDIFENAACKHGICSSGVCNCTYGYGGKHCTDDLLCNGIDCGRHGLCSRGQCHCFDKFSGETCTKDPCSNVDCGHHGKCNYGKCTCYDGFNGSYCTVDSLCGGIDCGQHGNCNRGKCTCRGNYAGEYCSKDLCLDINCSGHGRCDRGICHCWGNFSGTNCSKDLCNDVTCGGNGRCNRGACLHLCSNGQWSDFCDQGQCAGIDCHNGTCFGGTCDCFHRYLGEYCDEFCGPPHCVYSSSRAKGETCNCSSSSSSINIIGVSVGVGVVVIVVIVVAVSCWYLRRRKKRENELPGHEQLLPSA